MERMQRKAYMGLVALSLAVATPARAQDTTTTERTPQPGQEGTDSLTLPGQGGDPTGARDPGATSDTTAAAAPDTSSQAAAAQPAGQTAGQSRDPNGFRWTEPSDFAKARPKPPAGATDAVQPKRNEPVDSDSTNNE